MDGVWKVRLVQLIYMEQFPPKGYFIITDKYSDDSSDTESNGYSYQINYGNVASDNLVENPSLYLSKSGDTLKLYDTNGNLVDELTYGSSAKDVSWEKDDHASMI